MNTKSTYVLVSGGTGGHMFPCLSLGKFLNNMGHRVCLVTDERGSSFVGKDRCFLDVYIANINNKSKILRYPMMMVSVVWQILRCYFWYWRIKPTAVIGFGGNVSLAPLLAAQLQGIPTVIHEQNALLGRANRLLSRRAHRIATSFSQTRGLKKKTKSADEGLEVFTGNPVRPEMLGVNPYKAPQPMGEFNIVVIGGSQGASIFSDVVPKVLLGLPEDLQSRINIVQQCRKDDISRTKALYRDSKLRSAEVKPFIEDMDEQYNFAHLIICRSGASTIAELLLLKRPSVIVPYPYAMDNHQYYNALPLSEAGCAWLFREDLFTEDSLKDLLVDLMHNPQKLAEASERTLPSKSSNATANLAGVIFDVVGNI